MAVINFDGEPRAFKFTLASAREFKVSFGLSLLDAMTPDENGLPRLLDTVTLTQVLWAGLQSKGKTTFNQVERMLQKFLDGGAQLMDLYPIIGEAAEESGLFGTNREESDPNEKAEKAEK